MRLILASASQRRKRILEKAGYDFEVIPSDIEEKIDINLPHDKLVCELAQRKARAVLDSLGDEGDCVVLGSDTVVVIGDTVLGKPKDEKQAHEMLLMLSGKTHEVFTGVCIMSNENSESFSVSTQVEFYDLEEDDIISYIKTGEPMDKAGAYGIQGLGSIFIKGLIGDYYNVMGLPIARTSKALLNFSVRPNYVF